MERRYYLMTLRILNALLFFWILTIFFSLFNFQEILTVAKDGNKQWVVVDFIFALKDLISLLIFVLLYCIAIAFAFVIGGMFSAVGGSDIFNFVHLFFKNLLGSWFSFPDGVTPEFDDLGDKIFTQLAILSNDIYLVIFQLLFILAIFYVIRAIFQSNPKNNLRAIGLLVSMIIFPLIIYGFRDMLDLFGALKPINDWLTENEIINLNELANPLSDSFNDIPIDNFFTFISNPLILFAIVCYLYLEMAFQINYTDTVTQPSLRRSERLEAQLKLIRRESMHITTNIDKIKEEAKKKKEELGIEKESVEVFLMKKERKFSYIKEMIEKKKLESEEKKLITAASKTRRLGRYAERLFREDPEAEDTLTAKSSAPRSKNLAVSTLINASTRIIVLIFISYIIIHPRWFLINVLQLPDAISKSVAMYSPEAIIVLLLPIMLLFPVVAKVISFIKNRSLIMRLKQEGKIKDILISVGDYVKKEDIDSSLEEEPKVGSEEIATETT